MQGEHVDSERVLDRFHPIVAAWFRARFGAPTAPQARGWPAIMDGRDTLIAAPTGSGKTLAAFLWCINRLIVQSLAGSVSEGVSVLYISPLKALSNDVQRNLDQPLAELREVAADQGLMLPEIRTAVRTGDTPASERSKMVRKPPHILVTTPESLFIMLTSESGRAALAQVGTVIIDEIHALARDKRGAHLALSLERLDRLVRGRADAPGATPVRIGLSATQRPIDLIARMLSGARPMPTIVDGGHARALDLAIEMTDDELGAVASHEQMGRVYDRIAELIGNHKTTLVFVNTRRMVERVAHHLEERLGEDQVVAHHGSMSRKMRMLAEEKLKTGKVRCAVATASLELGIDVGAVDLVIQLGSPRSIATLLQRIGRSGHSLGATPKGRLFAVTRDQLAECAALVRAVCAHRLDAVEPPTAPLDILAQQITAAAACEELGEDEVFALVRSSFHYSNLDRAEFDAVMHMLSEGVSSRRGRQAAHIHRDRVNGRIKARRGARLAAVTSGGAIPDNANYQVILYPDETRVGEVDEDFAIDSSAGDVFLLGNTAWRIRRIESGRVIVEDAHGAAPTVPFWFGEAPARTVELSEEVSRLRADVERMLDQGRTHADIAATLAAEACMPRPLAEQLVTYLAVSRAVLGTLPTHKTLIAERFFDEGGGMQLIIHSPLGGRINRAWGLALRKRFCRGFNFELQAAATDDGIVISLGQPHSFPLESVFQFLSSETVKEILIQALLDAPMFEIRWRWNVTRALVVLRRNAGKKVPPHLLRMRADDLLSVVFPQAQACLETIVGDREVPDHPLVKETIRDCLTEAMDVERLRAVIAAIEAGEIRVIGRDTVEPSPLCHELISANPYAFLDDAPLEERRTRAVSLRRGLSAEMTSDIGALDPAAIAQAEDEAKPTVRDLDELHDALLSFHLMPETMAASLASASTCERWFGELLDAGRATRLVVRTQSGLKAYWVAAEREPLIRAAYAEVAGAAFEHQLGALPFTIEVPEVEVIDRMILGAHLDHAGPRTGHILAAELSLPAERVMAALYALESDGAILRGQFTAGAASAQELAIEWCNRRILARIHRLTLARLRSEVEPVSAAALMRFLFRWQRVSTGTQLIGTEGLCTVIEQLQGFESAAGAWEKELFAARLHNYDPAWLDSLCLSGQVAWCRLSPRRRCDAAGDSADMVPINEHADEPSDEHADEHTFEPAHSAAVALRPANGTAKRAARMAPTKAAPLAIMMRSDLPWLRAPAARRGSEGGESGTAAELREQAEATVGIEGLSAAARAVYQHLSSAGASFLAELVSTTGLAPAEVEDGLWELVGAGLATADGFASLRVLVDRRRGESRSVFDGDRAGQAPPSTRKWLQAVNKARSRERYRATHAVRSLPTAAGRWSLVGPPRLEAMDPEASARQLLARYGVVFRDLLMRESNLPPWREILIALRRLEARGEIRGGRFVRGFIGEQFALPEAVEGLRAVRNAAPIPEHVRVAATDPLNLVGITAAGPKVPAVMGNAILYRDGVAIASLEAGQVVIRAELEEGAWVDEDLVYHAPPRRQEVPSAQVSLPFL